MFRILQRQCAVDDAMIGFWLGLGRSFRRLVARF